MCGRFTLRSELNMLLDQFAVEAAEALEWEPRYNIAPTTGVLAVRFNAASKRELVKLRWGLIPSWAKDAKLAQINARADTAATKPMFRSAFKKRRCLILADGYYEWLREGKDKRPFLHEVDQGKPFAMAGLWEWWGGEGGKSPVESCAILTTDANELAATVHDRMPVILQAEDYDDWLAGEQVPLIPFPAERMATRMVGPYVSNARNQGEKCVTSPKFQEGGEE